MERKHQHILNIGRSLVYQSKLPKHAVFLMSRITSPLLKNESPYHILYDKIPDINDFKVFGCFVYETTIQSQRSKLDFRGSKVVFMGYKTSFKGSPHVISKTTCAAHSLLNLNNHHQVLNFLLFILLFIISHISSSHHIHQRYP